MLYFAGMSYPTRPTYQPWRLLISTYLHQWNTFLPSSSAAYPASKDQRFHWQGIHKLAERWQNCVASDNQYFESHKFNNFSKIYVPFQLKGGLIFIHLVRCAYIPVANKKVTLQKKVEYGIV